MEARTIALDSASLLSLLPLPCSLKETNIPHVADHFVFKGVCLYFHYNCDGIDDTGWGCGYRSLQTLCSWLDFNSGGRTLAKTESNGPVLSVRNIQRHLVDCGDKPASFLGSRQWIGCFEGFLVLSNLYKHNEFRVHHSPRGEFGSTGFQLLEQHFKKHGSPVMMGGDVDSMAKCVLGTARVAKARLLLVADPHYVNRERLRPAELDDIIRSGYLRWVDIEEFDVNSFYNILMPLSKTTTSTSDSTDTLASNRTMFVRRRTDSNDSAIIELDFA